MSELMKGLLFALLAAASVEPCGADLAVWSGDLGVSAPSGGVAAETNSLYPFLIKQAGLASPPSMRYQQVYNSTLFSNWDGSLYLEGLTFALQFQNPGFPGPIEWTVPSMQVNLSTTSKTADTLSPVFAENVGPDDEVVLGPGAHGFEGSANLFLERSFRYNPARGNLLLDVRIFDGTGMFDSLAQPTFDAFGSASDEVSRVWSTNVTSYLADGVDTIGLKTGLYFSRDFFLTIPAPRAGEITTLFPFLIKQTYPQFYPSNIPVSMHYQQVYSSTLFTNLDPSLIYLTSLTFLLESPNTNYLFGWTIFNLQISLSTTTNSVRTLSPVFRENIGADEAVVVGSGGTNQFLATTPDGPLPVYLTTPFRYNPARGNLLLDVRLSDMSGPGYSDPRFPYLEAFNTPTNLVARAWSTNVTGSAADGMDGTGLTTIFQFSPMPSLKAEFFHLAFDGETNIIKISWPSQPSIFQLQRADQLGTNTIWRNATNQILGSAEGGGWFIWVPATSAGAQGFYRLVWPNGQ